MEEKYLNYIKAFNELDDFNKKEEILRNIKDLMNVFYKIANDFDETPKLLPTAENSDYLLEIFTYVLSLKEMSTKTLESIYDKLYE